MKNVLRLALNDVRLTARDRPALIWMLVLPLAMMWLFGNAFDGGGGGSARITLTVVDRDGGWLARAFVEELQDETLRMNELTPEKHAAADPDARVRSLIIPAGFTEQVLAGNPQVLRLEREAGSNQEFGLAGQMHIVRTIVRTVGRLIETGAEGEAAFLALGEREVPVRLEVSQAGRGRPVPSGFNQSVPGILTMIVLMMTLIYGAVFLTLEKQTGMLRRQQGLPLSRMKIYLGKLGGRLLIAGVQLVVLVVLGSVLFPVSWGGSPLGLVLVLGSFAVAVSGLATLLGALLHTPAQASAVGWIGSMGMAGLGGCWWPAEVMPDWLRTAAHTLPTAWAMDGLHELISFGRGADAVLVPSAVLLGFGAVFAILGARWLRFD
jgi:ABC-type multidrug transport system permease subunit